MSSRRRKLAPRQTRAKLQEALAASEHQKPANWSQEQPKCPAPDCQERLAASWPAAPWRHARPQTCDPSGAGVRCFRPGRLGWLVLVLLAWLELRPGSLASLAPGGPKWHHYPIRSMDSFNGLAPHMAGSAWPATGEDWTPSPGRTFNDATLRRRQQRHWAAQWRHEPQAEAATLKYHLNHRQPPGLVALTVERRQRAAPADSMLAAASEPHAARLVQLQLPIQLHLKLRPLALPQPPPQVALASSHKRRRSIERAAAPELAPPADQSATRALTTWQEGKRVLLANSLASPLVQWAARKSLEQRRQRHATSGQPEPEPELEQQGKSASRLENRQGSLVKWPDEQAPLEQLNELTSSDVRATTPMTSASTSANTGAPLGNQDDAWRHRQRLQQNSRPAVVYDDEARIQALAAAMLPYVWPSFQLISPPSTHSSWPLKYQQLERATSSTPTTLATSATPVTPAQASDWRPSVAAPEAREPERPVPKMKRRETTTTTTTTTTTNTPPPVATSTSTATPTSISAQKAARATGAKKHKWPVGWDTNNGKHEHGAHLNATDGAPLSARYQMPRLKFAAAREAARGPGGLLEKAPGRPTEVARARQTGAQMPANLIRIIERQLRLSNGTASKQTAALLQYLATPANQTAKWAGGMLAPTTSVSKVTRMVQPTASGAVLEIEVNSTNSVTLARPSSSTAHQQKQKQERKKWNATRVPDLERTKQEAPGATATSGATPTGSSESGAQERRSLGPPTSTRAPSATTSTSTTTSTSPSTTTSSTTTRAPSSSTPGGRTAPPADVEHNEVLAERVEGVEAEVEEDDDRHRSAAGQLAAPTTSTARPARLAANATLAMPNNRIHHSLAKSGREHSGAAGSNIKLFHFKRKPDMAKLPFYKKPVNLTELGWTAEQIERELAKQRAEGAELDEAPEGEDGERPADQRGSPLERNPEAHDDSARRQLLLLKRKRRAKNQFERLMAELQAAAAAANETQPPAQAHKPHSAGEEADEGAVPRSPAHRELVPALKKKQEPLVMKPMALVMSQKRLRSGAQEQPAATTSGDAVAGASSGSNSTTSGARTPASATRWAGEQNLAPDALDGVEEKRLLQLRSKPIVRMRRKHHGEQPAATVEPPGDGSSTPWRPSTSQVGAHLVLVPSGLLTPSGSHPVPMFSAPLHQRPQEPLVAVATGEAAREQPAPVQSTRRPAAGQLLASLNAAPTSELRVPKLLVKPMRPAKYSLNGYIPKPSLGNALGAAAANSAAGQQQPIASLGGNSRPPPTARQTAAGRQTAPGAGSRPNIAQSSSPSAAALNLQNKDLDSSTSNEIGISRRRGLQQRQPAERGDLASFQQPTGSLHAPSSAQQLMEANRRKYVKQHQASTGVKSRPLSLLRANQIKAKLGLPAASSSSATAAAAAGTIREAGHADTRRATESQQQQEQAASAPAISTLDAPGPWAVASRDNELDEPASGKQQLVGAAPSAIPKTNFECTDKRGRFVPGLFADTQTGCQVWHLCSNNRKYSFLCPAGTIFNAQVRICDWRYNVKCQ